MFNLRGVVQFFAFDPLDRKIIYAQADGLWRSEDSGDTWSLVHPKPSDLKEIKMSSDHADEELVAEANLLGTISAMAIDPSDSRMIYAAAGDKKKAYPVCLSRTTEPRIGRSRKTCPGLPINCG